MKLGCALFNRFSGDLQRILYVVRVCIGFARRSEEVAELAVGVAYVSRIKMAVDVEVGRATVKPSSYSIRKFGERRQVVGLKENNAFIEAQALASFNFNCNLVQSLIV